MPPSSPDPMEPAFRALRKACLDRMTGTIEGLKKLRQSVGRGSGQDPLHEPRQAFHRLAGSGATYGYPAITEVGRAAQTYLDELLRVPHATPSDAASRLAAFIQDLEKAHAEARWS